MTTVGNNWMAQGRCRGMDAEVFFPADGSGVPVAAGICLQCQVRTTCLAYALRNGIRHGVWGGTSERERGRIARRWRAQPAEVVVSE